jgi:hypothetical protein
LVPHLAPHLDAVFFVPHVALAPQAAIAGLPASAAAVTTAEARALVRRDDRWFMIDSLYRVDD